MSKRNENRPGYKKTKVGWIPEEWTPVKLGNCFKLASGETKPSIISEYPNNNENVPVYGGNGILGYTSQVFDDCKCIIIGRVGEKCGCVHLVKGPHFITDNALYTKAWLIDVSIEYFAYFFDYFKLSRLRNKGGQPLVSQKPIYAVTIPLPPLPEQKKTAEILSAWDRAIEQVGKLIGAKERLKKGLIQQLLTGRMRFPEFGSANKRVKTHFYDFPLDWKHPRILEVACEVSEKNTERIDYPVLSCSKYDGFVNSLEYFGKKIYSNDTSNYKVIKQGQFGFPSNHIEEGSIGLLTHVAAGIVSPIYTIFETNSEKVFAPYLYVLFKTDTYQHIFRVNTNSSVDRRGSLRWNEFSKIRVPLPSLAEQIRIAAVLSACDREIELLKKKQEKLKEQKKGLMQKLLTGEVRVKIWG